jgi:hypothetical protein
VRWVLLLAFACSREKPAPPPAPKDATVATAPIIDAPPIDAPLAIDAARGDTLSAKLVLDVVASRRIEVSQEGPVSVNGKFRALDTLRVPKRVPRELGPDTFGARYAAIDGTMWLRVDTLGERPVILTAPEMPAIRIFEVASAVQPTGAALAIGEGRGFGFRVVESTDREPDTQDKVDITIHRDGRIEIPPIPADGRPRWAFIDLIGSKHSIATVVEVMDALAPSNIVGISFIAGKPRVPSADIEGFTNPYAKRALFRYRKDVIACYSEWIIEQHSARSTRVELAWTVDSKGTAASPRASGPEHLAKCIEDIYAKVTFNQQPSPLVIRIELEPDGGDKR